MNRTDERARSRCKSSYIIKHGLNVIQTDKKQVLKCARIQGGKRQQSSEIPMATQWQPCGHAFIGEHLPAEYLLTP